MLPRPQHAAESLRQAAIHRQVAPFNTEGLPAGHLAGSLLNSVIAERRRARPAAQQTRSARQQHGSPRAQQQSLVTQRSRESGLQQPQSPTGSESADVLPSQEEFGELLRQSQVPPADVHSFVQRAALLASGTKAVRLEVRTCRSHHRPGIRCLRMQRVYVDLSWGCVRLLYERSHVSGARAWRGGHMLLGWLVHC